MSPARSAPLLRLLGRILRAVAGVYIGVLVLTYLFQRRLQYFPVGGPVRIPAGARSQAGSPALEEVELRTEDGVRLEAWHWRGTRPVTIYILHGNGGHRGHRYDWIEAVHALGYGVFILDYRGYGGSEGSPDEEGLYRDAEAGARWLRAAEPESKLVYFGESIGAAVGVELAAKDPPVALILQGSFPSAVDLGASVYPYLPVRLLMKDRYEAVKRIGAIHRPMLFIHGGRDNIVPPRFGRALFDAAREPKEWFEVPGAGHNDLPWTGGEAYFQRIDEFIRRAASGTEGG